MNNNTVYESHKKVLREPMSRVEYNTYRGWKLPDDEDGSDEGYLVEYLDGGKPNDHRHEGYISWSPKPQFDEGYTAVVEGKTDWRLRIVEEYGELVEKFVKLNNFLLQGTVDTLTEMDKDLLAIQAGTMKEYAIALQNRINRFDNSGNDSSNNQDQDHMINVNSILINRGLNYPYFY